MPVLTAKLHGAKYRFMYQVYASPKYREYGKAFFQGVNIRYDQYARQLSGKLGLPVDLIQGYDGNLNPTTAATRAEVATIFMRWCEMIGE